MSSLRHSQFLHVARNPTLLSSSLETMAGLSFCCNKHFMNCLVKWKYHWMVFINIKPFVMVGMWLYSAIHEHCLELKGSKDLPMMRTQGKVTSKMKKVLFDTFHEITYFNQHVGASWVGLPKR